MSDLTGNKNVEQTLTGSLKTSGSVNGSHSLTGILKASNLNDTQPLHGKMIPRGYDGFSPIINIEETDSGVNITIEDVYGVKPFQIKHGVSISSISIEEET